MNIKVLSKKILILALVLYTIMSQIYATDFLLDSTQALIDNTIDSKAYSKEIKAEDLHVYKILEQAKIDIGVMLSALEHDTQRDPKLHILAKRQIFERLQLLAEQQALLITIIHGFNVGFHGDHLFYYPEIELKFVNACNLHKDIDIQDLKLHHVRALKKKFISVNRYVKTYCRTHRIKSDDIALFNNIILFNQKLTDLVLDEQCFNVDWYDSLIDMVYHRPLEFIGENKAVSVAIGAIAVGLLYYYVIKPKWDEYWMFQNLNKIYDMKHLKTVRQDGADCGHHALLNALIKANCTQEQAEQLLTDKKLHDVVIGHWKEFIADRRKAAKEAGEEKGFDEKTLRKKRFKHEQGSEWLHDGEVAALLQNDQLKVFADEIGIETADVKRPFIVQRSFKSHDFYKAFYREELGQQVETFKRTHEPQHMMVMIPGHYIAVSLEADIEKKQGVNVELMDSMWGNYTDHPVVEELTNLFAQKNALKKMRDKVKEREALAEIFVPLDKAQGVIDHAIEGDYGDLAHAPENALRHLRECVLEAHDHKILARKHVRDRLGRCFRNLRVFARAHRSDHRVALEDGTNINFDTCTTVDDFIGKITGSPVDKETEDED